jgi:hypothetical protein
MAKKADKTYTARVRRGLVGTVVALATVAKRTNDQKLREELTKLSRAVMDIRDSFRSTINRYPKDPAWTIPASIDLDIGTAEEWEFRS